MMGSGKSIIGSKFAKIIKFDFIDTDALIEEKTGKSINQIFDNFGEAYFRELEEKYISKILLKTLRNCHGYLTFAPALGNKFSLVYHY